MKKLIPYLLAAFIIFIPSIHSHAITPGASTIMKQKNMAKQGKRPKKRLKYVAPSQKELEVGKIPLTLPIPLEVVDLLSNNQLEDAAKTLRIEPPSSRSLYLLREIRKITSHLKEKKTPRLDQHKFYQNLGIAHHNLFLFLKRHGIINKPFYLGGIKFYKKAMKTRSMLEQSETKILIASLMAANGETEPARKVFSKIDTTILEDDFQCLEFMASYFAAMGDAKTSIEKLEIAYTLNPEETILWLGISDDFVTIENDPEFKEFLTLHHPLSPQQDRHP